MAYISAYSGEEIDANININSNQNNRLTTIETKLDTIEEGANKFELTNDSIQTSYIKNEAVTAEKLSPEVAESLASIKIYQGTLIAEDWIDDLSDSEDYSLMKNKWKWEKFDSVTMSSSIRDTLLTATPNSTAYYADGDIAYSLDISNSYTARCTTYIYCPVAIDYSCTVATDDAGAVYINGTFIKTLVSCEETAITIPFQAGANCLEVFYTEGTGDDGWEFFPDMSSRIGYEFSAMYAVPAHTYYQTIIPICLDGTSKINSNTVFSPGVILNGNISDASLRDKINAGYVIGNDDGSIKVIYNHTIPIEEDITLYWFGKTIE